MVYNINDKQLHTIEVWITQIAFGFNNIGTWAEFQTTMTKNHRESSMDKV